MHSIVKKAPFFDDQLGFLIPSPFTLNNETGIGVCRIGVHGAVRVVDLPYSTPSLKKKVSWFIGGNSMQIFPSTTETKSGVADNLPIAVPEGDSGVVVQVA